MGRPDTPMTIAEAARLGGMSVRSLRRRLVRLHRLHGETLLVRVAGAGPHGARWLVSLSALRSIFPSFGRHIASPAEVNELAHLLEELRRDVRRLAPRVGALERAVRELRTELDCVARGRGAREGTGCDTVADDLGDGVAGAGRRVARGVAVSR